MKRTFLLIIFFFLVGTNLSTLSATQPWSGWKAGVAREIITPDQPIWMAGYAARNKPADGKLGELWAKALFLEDAKGKQAILITMDLCALSKKVSDRIRDRFQKELGLTQAGIILNSSHTHSGPVVCEALTDIYPTDDLENQKIERYTDNLVKKIIELGIRARNDLEPATIYAENGTVRFQVNRRNNKEAEIAGVYELNGPNDYAVPVVKVVDAEGKIKAIAFGYACHATTLNGYQWSGDYPGYAQSELEKHYKDATALFFQGCGADQNPIPRRTIPLAVQYGKELAAAVECVLNDHMRELDPQLNTAYSETSLPLNNAPTKSELEKMEKQLSGHEKRWASTLHGKLSKGEKLLTTYPYPVQVWRLGEQMIVSLGGEPLIDYSIQLKEIFGHDIFVLGYSNDVAAYIPSEKVLQEGGYEVTGSPRVYGLPSVWKPGIQKQILGEAVSLAYQTGIPETPALNKKLNMVMHHISGHSASGKKENLIAKSFFSGFDLAHDTYNAISRASNGKIYYVLSSESYHTGGQMYCYDPESDKTSWLGDLTEICGEKGKNTISQGKSHVRFYESQGKLYFATHVGYYEMIDGMECLPVHAPEGYKLYPGGHFLSYSLQSGRFEDLAIVPNGEGVLTMIMDTIRNQIYGITWPKGYFIHFDLNTGKLKNRGQVSANGESGQVGKDYRVLCRAMFVDPRDGRVYYSTSEGDIFFYNPKADSLQKLDLVTLKLDYFGSYDPAKPGNMGYNWRSVVWNQEEQVAYGVHGNSGYLFRFDPGEKNIEIVDRITSEPSRKSGMFDLFSYGYLGFDLGYDKETLYYLTGGPVFIDGKRIKGVDEISMGAARGVEDLHLITFHIPTRKYTDHGAIFYSDGSRPTYVNSIAIGKDGNIYTLARFEHQGKLIEDLVKIPDPLKKHGN